MPLDTSEKQNIGKEESKRRYKSENKLKETDRGKKANKIHPLCSRSPQRRHIKQENRLNTELYNSGRLF